MNLPFFSTFENPVHTDIHSHLLPGIDDGVRSMEESLIIIRKFRELGYSKLITTPHIMSHMYQNTTETIADALEKVQAAVRQEDLEIEIAASAEYFLDQHFLEILKKGDMLHFGQNYLLFETSYQSRPMILNEAVFEMQSKGYIPVLAHPERYLYLHEDIDRYHELKELGVLFQVNVKSLKSHSAPILKNALRLIDLGLVDFIGSDVHRVKEINDFSKLIRQRMYRNIFKKNRLLNNSL